MKKQRQIQLVLVLVFALLVLVACGRDRGDAAPEDPTPAATEAATEADPEPTPVPEQKAKEEESSEEAASEEEEASAQESEQEAASDEEAQPESPIGSPESPLEQPGSPLDKPDSPLAGPDSPLPTPVPDPEAGASTVVGRLINIESRQPLASTVVRLAEIVCPDDFVEDPTIAEMRDECVFSLDSAFSPSASTDDNGDFIFESVVSDDYVLFIGDHMMDHAVVMVEGEGLAIYQVKPDEVLYLDDVAVDF